MLGVEHTHEPKARGAVEHARVEQDGRDCDLALELLEQRERAIEREERPDSNDEAQVPDRITLARDRLGDQLVERPIPAQNFVDGLDRCLDPDGSLGLDLLIERELVGRAPPGASRRARWS